MSAGDVALLITCILIILGVVITGLILGNKLEKKRAEANAKLARNTPIIRARWELIRQEALRNGDEKRLTDAYRVLQFCDTFDRIRKSNPW